jgi:hypothetical protein
VKSINLRSPELAAAFYSLAVAGLFGFLSFHGTDAETYLFPRIIAIVLLGFSIILLVSNLQASQTSVEQNADQNSGGHFIKVLPGLVIGFIYLTMMETVGFYASSFFVFLAFLLLYGKREMTDPKAFVKKVTVSIGFVFVLYLLFWQGLNVRTPTGWLF